MQSKLLNILFHPSQAEFCALFIFISPSMFVGLFPPSVNVNIFYFETDQFTSPWKSLPMMW